jgi:PPOX class probable F420-dependent enzyme
VWFVLDGDDVLFMTAADTVKGRSLARDPRACLVVDLEEPPYGFVLVEGTVTLSDDLTAMLPVAIEISARYVGAEQAETYGRRNAVRGELLGRLHPTKLIGVADMMG